MGDTSMGTVYYNHGTCKMKQTGSSKCTKSVDVTPPATKLSCTDAAYGWAGMKVPHRLTYPLVLITWVRAKVRVGLTLP